ncbi:hypothetical protein B7463_g11694, partial [Scytalidium lignicola]
MAEVQETADAAIAESLDEEIAFIQAQSKYNLPISPITFSHKINQINPNLLVDILKSKRKLQAAAILSSRTSQSILTRLRNPNHPSPNTPTPTTSATSLTTQPSIPNDTNPLQTPSALLLATSKKQSVHNQECTYRACASITTFKIHDPDPHAVDGGSVLGIRIDVGSSGKFIRPYYIMLNKPYPGSNALRIHRHTVPPCIPIASFAARYLPPPSSSSSTQSTAAGETMKVGGRRGQDLTRFVRALRREVVQYHNRIVVIKALRKAFGLDEKVSAKGKGRERVLYDISAADAEAKQLRIEWVDGRIGRCVVGERGEMLKCVVIGEDGRDREMERRVLGGDRRMEGIATRLKEGRY